MASAWGKSFGAAWGNAWGLISQAVPPMPTGPGRVGGGFPGYSTSYMEPDRNFNPLAALEKDDEEVILLATSWLMEITANG